MKYHVRKIGSLSLYNRFEKYVNILQFCKASILDLVGENDYCIFFDFRSGFNNILEK